MFAGKSGVAGKPQTPCVQCKEPTSTAFCTNCGAKQEAKKPADKTDAKSEETHKIEGERGVDDPLDSPRQPLQRTEGSKLLLDKPSTDGSSEPSPRRKGLPNKFGSLRGGKKALQDKDASSSVIDPGEIAALERKVSKKEAKRAKKDEKRAKREAKLAERRKVKEEKKKKKSGKSNGSLVIGGPSGFQRGHHVEVGDDAVTGVPETWKEDFEKSTGKRTETVSAGVGASAVIALASSPEPKKGTSNRKGKGKEDRRPSLKARGSGELSSSDWNLKISAPTGPMIRKVHIDADLKWEGDPDEIFNKLKMLGQGAYGSVYLAEHIESGMQFAMKLIPNQGKAKSDIMKEIHILKKCSHKNVVQYYGCLAGGSMLYIMMELCGGGSADDIIKHMKEKRISNEEQVAAIMLECMKGLVYLHAQGVVHRDIKSGNILVTDKGAVKLADFGVSAQFEGEAAMQKTTIGTPLWMAPEVLNGDTYSEKCDIWSMAITAIELADGKPPHADENLMRAMLLISTGDPPTLKNHDEWSDEFHAFLEHCLIKEPEDRPTAKDLLADPWLVKAAMAGKAEEKVLEMLASQVPSDDETEKADEEERQIYDHFV